MENNQIFEADAGLEAGDHEQNRAGHLNGDNVGVKGMVVANGGYDKHLASSTEESPLLPNGSDNGRIGLPGGGDNGDAATGWPGETDFEGLPWWKRPSVYWLLPAYGIFAIAFGGIVVPRLNLVLSLICREYLAARSLADPTFTFVPVVLSDDNPQCRIPEVNALATKFMLYLGLIGGILAAITSPKIGALSDRYGRKPLFAFTITGGLVAEALTILTAKYPDRIHYSWQLAGAVADGVCGSMIAGWALIHSYATDCTPPAKRAIAFGYLHACLFTGIAVGPIVTAYIVKITHDILSVFYFAITCHLFFFVCIAFVIPESLSEKRQLAAREKFRAETDSAGTNSNIYSSLRSANLLAPLKILYPTGEGSSPQVRANLLLLSAVDTIIFGVAMGAMNVVLYYSEYQFGWETFETSIFVSIVNSCRVFALVIVLPFLNYLVRTRHRNRVRRESGIELIERNSGSDNLDLWTIRTSLLFEIVGYGGYALVRTSPLFIMSGVFASFGGIGSPTLKSALTKHVPLDRTGQLLGATGLLHALARVVCPTVFSMIYASTVDSFAQAVFWVLAGCFVAAFLCSLLLRPHVYLEEPSTTTSTGHGITPEDVAERIADEEVTGI